MEVDLGGKGLAICELQGVMAALEVFEQEFQYHSMAGTLVLTLDMSLSITEQEDGCGGLARQFDGYAIAAIAYGGNDPRWVETYRQGR